MKPYDMLFEPRTINLGNYPPIEYHARIGLPRPASGWWSITNGVNGKTHLSMYEFWRYLVLKDEGTALKAYYGNMIQAEHTPS